MSNPDTRPAERRRRRASTSQAAGALQSATASAPVTWSGKPRKHFAVIGAGVAGVACARTLAQAGHRVTVFEKADEAGGRTTTVDSPFGNFDAGAQYFTIRDPRFARAIDTVPGVCKRWSASSVCVLDATGRVAAAGLAGGEAHWVASPGMQSLVSTWAEPLRRSGDLVLQTRVMRIERDAVHDGQWQLRTAGADEAQRVFAGFDAVLLAMPSVPAQALLASSSLDSRLADALATVAIAPCWTLLLAYPQAVRPGLTTLGPQWNAARSTHHRIAWLARESSKPGRNLVERWTVQASPAWSAEHLEDDEARVKAKLLKAFSEITGIRAEPSYVETRRWRYAQTIHPLGRSHLWDAGAGIGACGDWCLGHRMEDAFVSGLELALAVA